MLHACGEKLLLVDMAYLIAISPNIVSMITALERIYMTFSV